MQYVFLKMQVYFSITKSKITGQPVVVAISKNVINFNGPWYFFNEEHQDISNHTVLSSSLSHMRSINSMANNGFRHISVNLQNEDQYYDRKSDKFIFKDVQLIQNENRSEIMTNSK